jgi:hypothetical protein
LFSWADAPRTVVHRVKITSKPTTSKPLKDLEKTTRFPFRRPTDSISGNYFVFDTPEIIPRVITNASRPANTLY